MYGCYLYWAFIGPIDHKFPEAVATKLKRALYYTNSEVNPQKALSYYKQALALADEHEINPFSDEIIGIKLAVVNLLEKTGQYRSAIEVLEIIRADCRKWLTTVGEKESLRRDRTRILGWTVAVSIKLGELYANEYIDEPQEAEKDFVDGVETSLKEQRRREEEGEKEDEGPWMSNEAIGGSLEGS
jgi:tetratricopeptide (TPR) repeat protein